MLQRKDRPKTADLYGIATKTKAHFSEKQYFFIQLN